MSELSADQSGAYRRLLYGHWELFPTEAKFEQFVDDLGLFLDIPLERKNQAISSWHRNRKAKLNPYGKPTRRLSAGAPEQPQPNPFTLADGSAEFPNADKRKKSNAGRKVGGKNKPGHNAGGDRKSADFRAKQAKRLSSIGSFFSCRSQNDNEGADDDDGDWEDIEEASGIDASNNGDAAETSENATEEEERKRRKAMDERALKAARASLRLYAESFRNGSFNVSVDSDSDDEADGDIDDVNTGEKKRAGKSNFASPKHLPAVGSSVAEYLDTVKQRVLNKDPSLNLIKGGNWIPPPRDPISQSLGDDPTPNQFYLGDVWVYIFYPMVQYQDKMPTKFQCIRCKCTNTRVNNWFWKPCHWWDTVVYVLHQQIRCDENGCKACFATIDPRSLATLPTHVAERFPFTVPNERSPGYYSPMLLMLVTLVPHTILSGTFAKVINVLKRVKFAMAHISYLDEVDHWLKHRPVNAINASRYPPPFSPFADQLGYCGIKLSVKLLSDGLRCFMESMEQYMQAYFQYGADEGCSSDDSHKLTKHVVVNVGKNKVKPFSGTYTIMSLGGKVNISRFRFTKSNDELNAIIPEWAEARANAGRRELLRLEGDNAAGDSSQQQSASPSLSKDVVPFQEDSGLPPFVVTPEQYSYVHTCEGLKSVALSAAAHINKLRENGNETVRVGFDSEYHLREIDVFALDFEGDGGPKVLVHPYNWGKSFPLEMKRVLELDCVLIIGCNVANDVHLLRDQFGIQLKRMRDNRRYCLFDKRNQTTSLHDLGAEYLKLAIDKSHQQSNFNVKPPLALHLRNYAMGDAIASMMIDDAISARLAAAGAVPQHPPDLHPGAKVIIKIGGVEVATAEMVFLGDIGMSSGESMMWGDLYIGVKKAVVKIESVLSRRVRVPFQRSDWRGSRKTLGEVWDMPGYDRTLAVRSNQIRVIINRNSNVAATAHTAAASIVTGCPPAATVTSQRAAQGSDLATAIDEPSADEATIEAQTDADVVNDTSLASASSAIDTADATATVESSGSDGINECNIIRSREKSDRWHEHHNVPLKKDCPAAPFIHQLLRHATHAMNEVEQKNVESVLSLKGITNFSEHFFHNKEYWYRRVRMPPRKGDVASDNLLVVLHYLKHSDAFGEYVTEDVEKHINGWAKRCREGRYEDLPDVHMYDHDGYDSDGLDLWISRRGSKAENYHQKMKVAAGPFGIGVETAHYLQVILAFQYSISAGVARCNEPDFGHFLLNLEDRIQSRILQIYDIDLFPNRVNVSEQNPLDMICVGVGPLSHDAAFVHKGEPASNLRGDLRFMAKQMGVVHPPCPPATPREFGMIKSFMIHNPQPKQSDIRRLCETFLERTDGVEVLPKIPSLIAPAIKRFQINEAITLLKLEAGGSFDNLLEKLKGQTVHLDPAENSRRSTLDASRDDTSSPSLQRLPRPHVPPLCAPTQNQVVPISVRPPAFQIQRCAFYPICEEDPRVCGGFSRDLCQIYGTNGKRKTPTDEELARASRTKWRPGMVKRNCAWYPFCDKKAFECGGRRKEECSKFGRGGSDVNNAPSDVQLNTAKKEADSKRRAEQRREKRLGANA